MPYSIHNAGVFKVLSDLRYIYENVQLQNMELKRSDEYAYEISRYNFSNSETFVTGKSVFVAYYFTYRLDNYPNVFFLDTYQFGTSSMKNLEKS